MRITHVTNSLTRTGGGVSPVVWGLSMAQFAAGHDVSLATLSDQHGAVDWPVDRNPGMPVRVFDSSGPPRIHWSPDLHAALANPSVGGRIDVLHQHGVWTMISRSVHQWRKRFGGPTVITPHGMLDRTRLLERSKWKKRLFGLVYENRNLNSASCLHVICRQEAQSMRQYGLKAPMALIPNGVDLAAYADLPDPSRFVERFPRSAGRPIVLYLGRITQLKGLSPLLDAWRRLEDRRRDGWLLVLAGPNEFGFEDAMKRKAAALDLDNDVLFTGPLYDEAKREALSAASVFVLPSYSEGFAIALLEAMASKLPLVLTHQCNFDEVANVGAGWIGEPNADSLTGLLDECLSASEEERRTIGQRGYALVRERYTWDHFGQQLLSVYEWLLGGGSAPSCVCGCAPARAA